MASMVSTKNFQFWFVRQQDSFPLRFRISLWPRGGSVSGTGLYLISSFHGRLSTCISGCSDEPCTQTMLFGNVPWPIHNVLTESCLFSMQYGLKAWRSQPSDKERFLPLKFLMILPTTRQWNPQIRSNFMIVALCCLSAVFTEFQYFKYQQNLFLFTF